MQQSLYDTSITAIYLRFFHWFLDVGFLSFFALGFVKRRVTTGFGG